MATTKDWVLKKIEVRKLHLDIFNKRLSAATAESSPAELIKELAEDHKVYEIARSIKEGRYEQADPIIGCPHPSKAGHLVIVEGNRRLAAVKLLLAPDSAPPELAGKFRKLSAGVDRTTLKRLPVFWIRSREEADTYIALRHTRGPAGTLDWTGQAQAALYHERIQAGETIAQIAERFGRTEGAVRDSLRMNAIHRLFSNLNLEPREQALLSPRRFPVTNLERFFDRAEVRKELGIEYLDTGDIRFRWAKSEIEPFLRKLLWDARKGAERSFSRRVDNKDHLRKYLVDAKQMLPDRPTGKFETTSIDLQRSAPAGYQRSPKPPAKEKKSQPSTRMKPAGVIDVDLPKSGIESRVADIIEELERLPVADFPNAAGVLLRTLIETSVLDWIQAIGHERAYRHSLGTRPAGASSLLKYANDQTTRLQIGSAARSAVGSLLNRGAILSVDDLHAWVHNPHTPVDETSVRAFWEKIKPLLIEVLKRPV